jgi:hypothetical protein
MMQFAAMFMMLAIVLNACSGDDGAIGPDGAKGDAGLQGEVGPAGADGSIIFSGEGLPQDATGVKGDYYFDVATGVLYGPKLADDNWSEAASFSLKGETGEAGADGANGQDGQDGVDGKDGSQILTGEGAPSIDVGKIGDFYLDITSYTLYGPKTNSILSKKSVSWGPGLELKGADGNANVKSFKFTVMASDWHVYSNTGTSTKKTMFGDIDFPALNEDMFENGIILVYWKDANSLKLLPKSDFTAQKNFLTREGYVFKNSSDGKIILRLKNILKGFGNTTELLDVVDIDYRIKLIAGQEAEALKSVQQNSEQFFQAIEELGLID